MASADSRIRQSPQTYGSADLWLESPSPQPEVEVRGGVLADSWFAFSPFIPLSSFSLLQPAVRASSCCTRAACLLNPPGANVPQHTSANSRQTLCDLLPSSSALHLLPLITIRTLARLDDEKSPAVRTLKNNVLQNSQEVSWPSRSTNSSHPHSSA